MLGLRGRGVDPASSLAAAPSLKVFLLDCILACWALAAWVFTDWSSWRQTQPASAQLQRSIDCLSRAPIPLWLCPQLWCVPPWTPVSGRSAGTPESWWSGSGPKPCRLSAGSLCSCSGWWLSVWCYHSGLVCWRQECDPVSVTTVVGWMAFTLHLKFSALDPTKHAENITSLLLKTVFNINSLNVRLGLDTCELFAK